MKQLLVFLLLTFVLASCSDKYDPSDSKDSISITTPIDSSVGTQSTLTDDESSDPYSYSEIINKPGTLTLVTQPTQIYSDVLLQIPLEKLSTGEHLRIETYCGTTTKNNWTEPIYKISYEAEQGLTFGYVSQSTIACRIDTLKSQKLVTLTLDFNKSKDKFIGKFSLLNLRKDIIGTSSIELDITKDGDAPYSYSYYFQFEENESTGLDGVTESFSLTTDYGACGYVGLRYTFLWNENKLIHCPETFSIAEADIFSHYSYLIFPSDSLGKKGSIFEVIEGNEYGDVTENNRRSIQKDSTVIEYKWNPYSYISQSGDTIIKTSRTHYISADY